MAYNFKVVLTEYAQQDFDDLDGSLQKKAAKALEKLMKSSDYGERLGNKYGINLTGYYRLYFNDKKHRVIYTLEPKEDDIQVSVIAIGPRDAEGVYKIAKHRLIGVKKHLEGP